MAGFVMMQPGNVQSGTTMTLVGGLLGMSDYSESARDVRGIHVDVREHRIGSGVGRTWILLRASLTEASSFDVGTVVSKTSESTLCS